MKELSEEGPSYNLTISYCKNDKRITHDEYLIIKACISLEVHPAEYPLIKYTNLFLNHLAYVNKHHPEPTFQKRVAKVVELMSKVVVPKSHPEVAEKKLALEEPILKGYHDLVQRGV